MTITDLTGKRVRISKSTITLLDDNDKPAGMITRVITMYNVPDRERFAMQSDVKKRLGANWKSLNWKRLFVVGDKWYYLHDEHAIAWAYEFEQLDGRKPIEAIENALLAAEEIGAEVISVARIKDGREI